MHEQGDRGLAAGGRRRAVLAGLVTGAALAGGVLFAAGLAGCGGAGHAPGGAGHDPVPPSVVSFGASPARIAPGEGAVLSWSVTGADRVVLDQGLGEVAAVAEATVHPGATTTYVLSATNVSGTTSASATVTVEAPLAAPAGLSYAANPVSYEVGVAIAPNAPASTGGPVDRYEVTPALPAGLALDPGTGVVSGTPTAAAATATYQVTASNAAGQAKVDLVLTVVAVPRTLAGTVVGRGDRSGVAVALTGAATGQATTGADGAWRLEQLLPGSYVVTPARAGQRFMPPSRSVTLGSVDLAGLDFTMAPDGATVTLDAVDLAATAVSKGDSVPYVAWVTNWTGATTQGLILQALVEQAGDAIPAGGAILGIDPCAANGLPPGTCRIHWSITVPDVVVAGPAVALVQLKTSSSILQELRTPITVR